MEKKTVRDTLIQLVCAAVIFLLLFLFLFFLNTVVLGVNSRSLETQRATVLDLELEWFLHLLAFLDISLAFYSFSQVALYYDPILKSSCDLGRNRFRDRAKMVAKTPLFWYVLVIVLSLHFILPARLTLSRDYYRIAAYPVFGVLLFLSWTSVINRWNSERIRREISQKERNKKIRVRDVLKSVVGRIYLWTFFAVLTPFFGALLYSFVKILGLLSVPLLVFLFLIYPLILLIRYLRAVAKRRKMLKKLKCVCDEKEYSFYCEKPYRSILFPCMEPEIIIKTGKETIECKLLCALSRKTPIFLSPDGEATVVHSFRIGKWTLFRHYVNTRYRFGQCDRKIMIPVPTPRDVYAKTETGFHIVCSGERYDGYTLYVASSFVDDLRTNDLD